MRRARWIAIAGALLVGVLMIPTAAIAGKGGHGGGSGGGGGGGGGGFNWTPQVESDSGVNVIHVVCTSASQKQGHAAGTVTARVLYGSGTPKGQDQTTSFHVTWSLGFTDISAATHTGQSSQVVPASAFYPCTNKSGTWTFQPLKGTTQTGSPQNLSVKYLKVAS